MLHILNVISMRKHEMYEMKVAHSIKFFDRSESFASIVYLLAEVQFLMVSHFDARHDKQAVFLAFRSWYI